MLRISLAAALFFIGINSGQAAQFVWSGTFRIVAAGAGCTFKPIGYTALAKIRPPNIGDNGNGTRFALHDGGSSQSFRLQPGGYTTTFKPADYMFIDVGHGTSAVSVEVRFASVTPAFSQTARFVNVIGQVKGWGEDADCVVNFDMGLLKNL